MCECVCRCMPQVTGRDKEVARVIQILARRSKNNPLLLGEPGVGKTAIAEGEPDALQNCLLGQWSSRPPATNAALTNSTTLCLGVNGELGLATVDCAHGAGALS